MLNYDINVKRMQLAYSEALKAFREDEVPIGAVILHNDKVIGRGYNQVEQLKDSTAHAEIICITSAANSLNDSRLNDASIYVTKEPCLMCFGAIINSRIKNIYYGFSDTENGFRSKLKNEKLLSTNHLKHIEGSVLELDCKKIVEDFFVSKRKKNKKKQINC